MSDRNPDRASSGAEGRRVRAGRGLIVEALEGRIAMSTAAAGFLTPPPAVVGRAGSVIAGGASAEFSTYQIELQRVEAASRVTPTAFLKLQADGSALAQAIQDAPLTSQAVNQDLIELQDLLDQSFLDGGFKGAQWNQVSQQMGQALYGVTFTTNLPNQTMTDMQAVARQAHVTPTARRRLIADGLSITDALGPGVQTALGGAVPRNPLMVYYDGQVTQFVHKPAGRSHTRQLRS